MSYIQGTTGYEYIVGTDGDDTIDGLGGSDMIRDYWGNDTYLFNLGYGQPAISDVGGNDRVIFGQNISSDNLQFFRSKSNNLFIRVVDTIDKLEVKNWFIDPKYKIETFQFTDGSTISMSDVDSRISLDTNVLVGSSGNDVIKAPSNINNLIYAMQGSDTVYTNGGNNIIELAAGNDLVYNNGLGNDTIHCSTGTDYFEDLGGNDRYIFGKGDGQDIIFDQGGNDTIKFSLGVLKDDAGFSVDGDNLIVSIKDTSDRITIKNWMTSQLNKIENFEFWDGSKISSQEIDDKINTLPNIDPTQGLVPTVVGTNSYDYYKGLNTNDIYYLKRGNDKVQDYWGNDTYLFYRGDGQDSVTDNNGIDSIIFGGNIVKDDLSFTRVNNNVVISINGSTDKIAIIDWYKNNNYKIEKILFTNGTSMTGNDIDRILLPYDINGTTGADTLTGNNLNNTLYGNTGNDTITDISGDDIYLFNKGDGRDNITDLNGIDKIKFGQEITSNDLLISREGNNAVIKLKGTDDQITINNWFYNIQYKVERLEFADSSFLTSLNVENQVLNNWQDYGLTPTVTGTDGYEYARANNGDDVYYLKKGNDRVMDYLGNDTYLFNPGDGQDNITDQSGNDAIIFGGGISQNDATLSTDGINLTIGFKNSQDKINIINWFKSTNYQVEKIKFMEGSYFTNTDINQIIQQISASSGSNTEILLSSVPSQQDTTLIPVNA